jgi:hypothetical protein
LGYYEKYIVTIIDDDEYKLIFEYVFKKSKKKEDRILLKEMKGTMVDNTKLKKLSGVQVVCESRES